MAKDKNKTDVTKAIDGELRNRLIKLREDAGYDASQIADVLCLSKEVIHNLENENIDLLPQPAYVHGYLRNYAKLGEQDPQDLINCYESLRGADAHQKDYLIKSSTTISTAPQKSLWGIWLQLILLGVLLGGITMFLMVPEVKTWVEDTWKSFSTDLEQPTDASGNPSLLGELPVPTPLSTDTSTEVERPEQISEQSSNTDPVEEAVVTVAETTSKAIDDSTEITTDTETSIPTETTNTDNNSTLSQTTDSDSSIDTSISDSVSNTGTSISETLNTLTSTDIMSTTESSDIDENPSSNVITEETQVLSENITDQTEEAIIEAETTTSESIIAALSNTPGLTVESESNDSPTAEDGSVNVRLVFNKEIWLRVKDKDSKTVFEGLNQEGTNKVFNAIKPLTFRVGNADGLSLFIDNKAIDINSHINGTVANFTLD